MTVKKMLAQPAVLLVFGILGFLLFCWPILQIAGDRGTLVLFDYIFTVWAAVIVLLWMVGRAIHQSSEDATENSDGPVKTREQDSKQ